MIGGFTDPQGARAGFGALMLGVYENGKLRYAGKVGTGFDDSTLRELHRLLVQREQDKPPFANPPRGFEAEELTGQAGSGRGDRFTEWSNRRRAAPPVIQGLPRTRRPAMSCARSRNCHPPGRP